MLNSSQLRQFETQGYLVLERFVDEVLLQRLEAEYSEALDRQIELWVVSGALHEKPEGSFFERLLQVNGAGLDWFQPLDISLPMEEIVEDTPFHMGPAVFDLLNYAPLLDVAESLLGPELAGNPIQHVRIKPPSEFLSHEDNRAHVSVTAWHQDRGVALADADNTTMVTAWVAITDACIENGCLTVIPGPVSDSLLLHCPAGQTHIPDTVLDKSSAIPLEVPRGSAVLIHPSTPHASLSNFSDRFRWSFDLRFHRLGENSGRDHFPSFVVRSKQKHSVSDWREMQDAWLATRAKLAKQPHISLHRWGGDSPACA